MTIPQGCRIPLPSTVTYNTIAFAERCRAKNIAQSSGPTLNLCAILNRLGVRYGRQVVTRFDGDRFVLSEFWLPDYRLAIELDGVQHRGQIERDADKAQIIYQATGFRTQHVWNSWA